MNSGDLNFDQCHRLLRSILERLDFFRQLRSRMNAQSFPADDRFRQRVEAAEDAIKAAYDELNHITYGTKRRRP